MESGYVSREVSPSRQFTVTGPINIDRSVETGTTSNQSPESIEVITRSPDPPVINFHHKTSLKWLTVAMPLLENSKRQERDKTRVRLERDKRETSEKLEKYGAMKDGLS